MPIGGGVEKDKQEKLISFEAVAEFLDPTLEDAYDQYKNGLMSLEMFHVIADRYQLVALLYPNIGMSKEYVDRVYGPLSSKEE